MKPFFRLLLLLAVPLWATQCNSCNQPLPKADVKLDEKVETDTPKDAEVRDATKDVGDQDTIVEENPAFRPQNKKGDKGE
ncbi:MAG: hypothetical protein H6577_27710 [Lewinellaceae bacterium]|nr:hypothetical protein [Saprospiraceae bacterium]MCB9341932.1 hypothetical protein [Lewinellaceae bacterium]